MPTNYARGAAFVKRRIAKATNARKTKTGEHMQNVSPKVKLKEHLANKPPLTPGIKKPGTKPGEHLMARGLMPVTPAQGFGAPQTGGGQGLPSSPSFSGLPAQYLHAVVYLLGQQNQ